MMRTLSALAATLLGLVMLAGEALAQSFPARPIRVIVPYSAGGAGDVVARTFAQKLTDNNGWAVVVENRPGAGGTLAAEMVARAPADGHTLMLGGTAVLAINPSVYAKLPYDTLKDFTPVTQMVSLPLFFAISANLPVQSVRQFVDYARQNPGLNYGSTGTGSETFLGTELFKMLTGVNLTHVPYKNIGQVTAALMTGDINFFLGSLPAVQAHAKSGKLRLLSVTSAKRSAMMPDVPTLPEAGVQGFDYSSTIGFVAPTGTPRDVVERLNREFNKALASTDVAQRLNGLGFETIGGTPEQYGEAIRVEMQQFAKLVKATGAKAE
jgi:tripartite-type tricarboxylate transporter receptor subunit TctC